MLKICIAPVGRGYIPAGMTVSAAAGPEGQRQWTTGVGGSKPPPYERMQDLHRARRGGFASLPPALHLPPRQDRTERAVIERRREG